MIPFYCKRFAMDDKPLCYRQCHKCQVLERLDDEEIPDEDIREDVQDISPDDFPDMDESND